MSKLILLMGLPGSGKSTFRNQLLKDNPEYTYVCQDELGSRDACAEKLISYIKDNKTVIIDRTNISKKQRFHWLKLAKNYKIKEVKVLYFKSNPEACIKRILARKDHPTITPDMSREKVTQIVRRFLKDLEVPKLEEGFNEVVTYNTDLFGTEYYISQTNKSDDNRFRSSFFQSIINSTLKFFRSKTTSRKL